MNRNRLLMIGFFALAMGAFVSFLVYKNLQSSRSTNNVPGEDVLVAADDLQVGTRIEDKDIRFVRFPSSDLPVGVFHFKDKVVGRVTIHLGTDTKQVNVIDKRLQLHLSQRDGTAKDLQVDHVIAGTGYKVKLERLDFIDSDLRNQMEKVDDTPVLSTNFESSIQGLYLVGLASATSFGPLCRFAFGAQFTSDRIARHLASTAQKSPLGNRKAQSADLVTQ